MTIDGTDDTGTDAGLADRLKTRTWALHREAERSGILQDLLRGRAGREGYVLLLRNLLPVYAALEERLEQAPDAALVHPFRRPDLYRSSALGADLDRLAGPTWRAIPVLPAATLYATRIAERGDWSDERLAAHAYVRYLGDLNGGQILRRLLGRSLGLGPELLGFYDFPAIDDPEGLAHAIRLSLDGMALSPEAAEAMIAEAVLAFRLNIDLSNAVQHAAVPAGDAD